METVNRVATGKRGIAAATLWCDWRAGAAGGAVSPFQNARMVSGEASPRHRTILPEPAIDRAAL
ncbi:MAG: hypothetical protein ABW039_00470 [Sphingobium sp.]